VISGFESIRTHVEWETSIKLPVHAITRVNQQLLEHSATLHLTAYNNSLLSKDAVLLGRNVSLLGRNVVFEREGCIC
jgi:hypothetical protein